MFRYWSSWTATEAPADGTRELLDCAHGTVTPVPMTLVLSDPVNGAFTTLVETANGQSNTIPLEPPFYQFSSADPESSHVPVSAATSDAAGATVAVAAATGVPQDGLVTPSNNISCAIITGHFHCMILKYDFALGPCDIERAPFISLEPTGPATMSPCIGDYFAGVPRTPTAYGTVVQLGQISCDVEETGVRCTNPEGHGFTLSRAAFAPF